MDLPNKKYNIIYADPPWKYTEKNIPPLSYNTKNGKYFGVSDHYDTMDVEEIAKIPVTNITDKNCALFLWGTFPNLKEAVYIIESWGFRYVTVGFTWIKTVSTGKPFFGIGYYTKSNAEVCLLGMKGSMKPVSNKISSVIMSKLDEHSKKPLETRNRIVDLFGDVPRIELFARNRFDGWDAWGDQVSDTIQIRIEE